MKNYTVYLHKNNGQFYLFEGEAKNPNYWIDNFLSFGITGYKNIPYKQLTTNDINLLAEEFDLLDFRPGEYDVITTNKNLI